MPSFYRSIAALTLALTLPATATLAGSGQWKYSTGFDYSSGDYGGDPIDTDITYIPLVAAYTTGNWTFKGTAAWVEIEGPGTVIGAGDGGVVIGKAGAGNAGGGRPGGTRETTVASTESGVGDTWIGASYSVSAVPAEFFYLDLGAKLKLPTADEDKGLGTGELDYTLQADLFKPMDAVMPFATLAYKIKGDPEGLELDNVFYLSLGVDIPVSDTLHIGTSLDFQEASSSSGDNSMELLGYLSRKLDQQWSILVYGYGGLQDASPDYGFGLQLSLKP